MAESQQIKSGTFVETTDVYDIQSVYELDIHSDEFREFLVRLRQSINNIALALNSKDTGIHALTEFVTGKQWFPDQSLSSKTSESPTQRQIFRKVINFGALPNAATKTVAHGITVNSKTFFTQIEAFSKDPVTSSFIKIAHSNPILANNIGISVNSTNMIITTGSNRTNYTETYVILEYIQQ